VCQQKVVQLCEVFSRKRKRNARGSEGSMAGVLGVQHEVVQGCEGVIRKWCRSVRGSAVSGSGV